MEYIRNLLTLKSYLYRKLSSLKNEQDFIKYKIDQIEEKIEKYKKENYWRINAN